MVLEAEGDEALACEAGVSQGRSGLTPQVNNINHVHVA